LVPGGFGERGVEGKIAAIHYARTNRIPFFGICLGMQLAVVEYARHVCELTKANSAEFSKTDQAVITLVQSWQDDKGVTLVQAADENKGGTMRLGAQRCQLAADSLAGKIYQSSEIEERHRHRYEVNPAFTDQLEKAGLVLSGRSSQEGLVEMIEINDHPWFVACQFHPEFLSKPLNPHPLFIAFITAALEHRSH